MLLWRKAVKVIKHGKQERRSPAVVLLDYVINFGLGVSDGFNIYTRDQGGRDPSNSSLSKNGPLYDLSEERYVNNL